MPKSVARKASKRRSVPKRMRRKSTKRNHKHHKRGGYSKKPKSPKKSPKKSTKKSPKRRSSKKSSKKKRSSKKLKGGAYGFDLNDIIGGLPAVVKNLSCRGQPGSNLEKN